MGFKPVGLISMRYPTTSATFTDIQPIFLKVINNIDPSRRDDCLLTLDIVRRRRREYEIRRSSGYRSLFGFRHIIVASDRHPTSRTANSMEEKVVPAVRIVT